MADAKLYLRPIGFSTATRRPRLWRRAWHSLGRRRPISFTAAELIEGTPSSTERRLLGAKDLAASRDSDLARVLERITTPRQPFAGLAFTRPLIMGIVNVTPDSFSDGGLYDKTEGAIVRAAELAAAGADIVDVGESRPVRAPIRWRRATSSAAWCRCSRGSPGSMPQSPSTRERRPWRGPRHTPAPRSSTTSRR